MESSKNKHKNGGGQGRMIQLSKTLSYILRHGAEKQGLDIDSAGFVSIEAILDKKDFKRFT